MRSRTFTHKEADYRILSSAAKTAEEEIIQQRREIETYISSHPEFKTALKPLKLDPSAPASVRRMLISSHLCGCGPMAAVAGIIAECAARKAFNEAKGNTIVDNGGDIFMIIQKEIHIAIYAEEESPFNNLALCIVPEVTPLAICSSSGLMGHSLSFGKADLVTVFSSDAALADCAATMGANKIMTADDLQSSVEWIVSIPGIKGALAVKDDKIALAGSLPKLVRNLDSNFKMKVTHNTSSGFNQV